MTTYINSIKINNNQLTITHNSKIQNKDCQSCTDLNNKTQLHAVHNPTATATGITRETAKKYADESLKFYNISPELYPNYGDTLYRYIKDIYKTTNSEILLIPNPSVVTQYVYVKLKYGNFGLIEPNNDTNPSTMKNIESKISNFNTKWFQNNSNIDWTDKKQNWAGAQFRCINGQGQCGDCWANSTTECITMRLSIYTGYYCPLDIMELANCDTTNYGCNGGWMSVAMNWINKNNLHGPKCTSNNYNDGYFNTTCNNTPCNSSNNNYTVTCDSVNDLSSSTNNSVAKWNYTWENAYNGVSMSNTDKQNLINELGNGPVTIAIAQAGTNKFQSYNGGVYNWVETNNYKTDHAVLLVGYIKCKSKKDPSKINEYWKIQNSWKNTWGDNGYFYVAAADGNDDFDQTEENKAFPITQPTVCTPSFVKLPSNPITNYQSPGLNKCCPVDAFTPNVSCTALPNPVNYTGEIKFPLGLDNY